jgi:hypothetical protein
MGIASIGDRVYNARIVIKRDGKIRITNVAKRDTVNQHGDTWKRVNSRNLARRLNTGNIVIK